MNDRFFSAQESASSGEGWFPGDGVDNSDIRTSMGLQLGAKVGSKGIFGAKVELKAPLIETSLVTGNRYASDAYGLVIYAGKWEFGYEEAAREL